MTADHFYNPPKIVHLAEAVDQHGHITATCYKTRRRIDLRKASWTMSREDVSCPKCRKAMFEQAGKDDPDGAAV